MHTKGTMAAVRSWHPVRLALVCAMLAMAGGAAGGRGGYAEVSSAASLVLRAGARAHDARTAAACAVSAAGRASMVVARASLRRATTPFVVAPLYLAHCSLLL
ncbi:MAG: hypothetical protein LC659_08440 [Myxococcales bacterium]|nr:hypothetical protein [Myxococcales bacterium]